jgi:cysteine synthase B
LQLYGAAVILSEGAKGTNGAVELATRMAQDKRYYMPYQFGNPVNPLAHYETTGVEILEDLGDLKVDAFIAGIGTGGTLMGGGRRLKEHNPITKVIGVEPFPGDPIPGLRSLAEGFIPSIIDFSLIDQRTLVTSKEAIAAARDLLQREGIFAGPSSGAALHQAMKTAREIGSGNIVVVLPDGGWKYLSMDVWSRKDEL